MHVYILLRGRRDSNQGPLGNVHNLRPRERAVTRVSPGRDAGMTGVDRGLLPVTQPLVCLERRQPNAAMTAGT
jgi:hypothetical protein